MNSDLEDQLNRASYMWNEDKHEYALIEREEDSIISYAVYHIRTQTVALIEDYDLHMAIVANMREAGVNIYRGKFPK